MPLFKDDFTATLEDAVKIQRRFQKTLNKEHYLVSICGSTVTKGKGRDIDVVIVAADDAETTAESIAWMLMVHCKRLTFWTVREDEYEADVFLNFITHDDLYVDAYIKGLAP